MIKSIIFATIFLTPFMVRGQGGFFISNGANVVINNSPQIVIENGKFNNNGVFAGGGSTVHFVGTNTTVNSTIGGASVTVFNNLSIKKGEGALKIEIYDALGKLVYLNNLEIDGQFKAIDINEVSGFVAGNYFLTIKTLNEKYSYNLVKIGE